MYIKCKSPIFMFAAEFGSNYCWNSYILYDWYASWCGFTSLGIYSSDSQNFISGTGWWTNSRAKLTISVISFSSAKSGFLATSCVNSVGTSNLISSAVGWADGMSWAILSIVINSSLHTDGWVLATVGVFHWWAQDFSLEIVAKDWATMRSRERISWAEFSVDISGGINTNFFCWTTVARIYL